MTRPVERLIARLTMFAVTLLTIILIGSAAIASASVDYARSCSPAEEARKRSDMSRILRVLETRMKDQKSLQRSRDKLVTLDSEQLRLLASLCERISREGDTAGADIAFSLVTAMIILS